MVIAEMVAPAVVDDPHADPVPASSITTRNPIGRWRRSRGSEPDGPIGSLTETEGCRRRTNVAHLTLCLWSA